jgi:hypothetical protein
VNLSSDAPFAENLTVVDAQRPDQEYPKDAFILGAGFSRAVNRRMPTLTGVGQALRKRLLASPRYSAMLGDRVREVLEHGRIPSGNVELWLSSLAERQPFMSQSEGALNQALFQEISRLLIALVAEPQSGFWQEAPPWLHRLLRLWHRRRAGVVTFNYDTILEESMVNLDPPHADGDIVTAMLTQLPRFAFTGLGGGAPVSTFQLFKLHGSLDWYWNPDDRSGDSLCRLNPGLGAADVRAALAGKEPFVVPPLASKSPFYALGLVRLLWNEAAVALQAADRVVVLGYSVPLTDLATTAMLSQTANPKAEWHVVNTQPTAVRNRLTKLGIPASAIVTHGSVMDWVDAYEADHCRRMSSQLADQLLAFRTPGSQTAPIMTRRSRSDCGIVHAIRKVGARVLLDARTIDNSEVIPAEYPREPDLVEALLQMDPANPVSARLDNSIGEYRVLGAVDPLTVRGYGAVLDWCAVEIQDVPTS